MNRILNVFRSSSNLQPALELNFNQFYGLNFMSIPDDTKIIVNVPDFKECSVIYKFNEFLFYINIQNANPPSAELKKRFPNGTHFDLNDLKCSKHYDPNEKIIQTIVFNIKPIAEATLKAFLEDDYCVYCLALAVTNDFIPPIKLKSCDANSVTLNDHLNEMTYNYPHLNLKEMRDIVSAFQSAQTNLNLDNLDKITALIRQQHNISVAIALAIRHMENHRKNLATTKEETFRVSDVQLIAIIISTIKCNNTFLDVKTIEGKNIIIALIAAVKLLLGDTECVDIITCNEILAKQNHDDMKPFFASLRISSACNNPTDNDDIYKQQVVYGALHNFQYDELHTSYFVKYGRGCRKFALCIIDEIDLLTINNSNIIAKSPAPFPGIEELIPVYEQLFHTSDEPSNPKKVPKYLRNLCNHMDQEWYKACKRIKRSPYMKDMLIKDDTIDTNEPNSEDIALVNFDSDTGLEQFLEMYTACPVSMETFNPISASPHGFLKKYEQLCGVTGTLGAVENCGDMSESLLIKMFGPISFYRLPTYNEFKFVLMPTVVVKDGEFDVITRARKLGNQVKIYADNRNSRMNNLLELAKPCPEFEQDQIQILELDNYKPPLDSAITEVEIADNYIEPTNNSHVAFKNISYYPTILNDFQRKTCILYHDTKINWKLDIIDHLISLDDSEATNESHRSAFQMYLSKFLEKYDKITIYSKTPDFEINPKKIKINKVIVTRIPACAVKDANEAFVFPFLRGPKLNIYEFLEELDLFNDIVMLQSPKRTIMFTFGKYKKHFQIIDTHIQDILDQKRAVLVVFDNLQLLKQYKQLTEYNELAKIYNGTKRIDMIDCNTVSLTTNTAGRLVDFRNTTKLNHHGGLHIIFAFRPSNECEQWQALEKIARNGSRCSAEIIVNADNWSTCSTSSNDADATQQRNSQYMCELRETNDKDMANLRQQLDLITEFSNIRRRLSEEHLVSTEYGFVLDDLTEFWTVWLKINFKKTAKFNIFKLVANDLIEKRRFYNPCHWIRGARYYLCDNNTVEAKRLLYATFDQEVFGVAIVQEYMLFAQLAIAKGEMLSEAREALLKEPSPLNSERRELLKIIEEMLQNLPYTQHDCSTEHHIHKNILSFVQLRNSPSKLTNVLILLKAVFSSSKEGKFISALNYIQTTYSILRYTTWEWNANIHQTLEIAAKDYNIDVTIEITRCFLAMSKILASLIMGALETYADDFISLLSAYQKSEKMIQSIIADEITTYAHISLHMLDTIVKDGFEKFRVQERINGIDDILNEFRNHCQRINERIDKLQNCDDTVVIEPRIVMELFRDCIQYQMKQSFSAVVFKNQRKCQYQRLHNRQRNNIINVIL